MSAEESDKVELEKKRPSKRRKLMVYIDLSQDDDIQAADRQSDQRQQSKSIQIASEKQDSSKNDQTVA